MNSVEIPRINVCNNDLQDELDKLVKAGKPVVITGLNNGNNNLENLWTPEYLAEKLKNRTFSIHLGDDPVLDFRSKNFAYENKFPGDKFISDCAEGHVRYLRSVGKNFRKDCPNFWNDYTVRN
jgi:hypothetical protein